ncbi:hypothetical protein EIP91_000601 [Steccherinum ochraceum]|uniref:Arrestin C-terminal-like domain-containing protein n=1 Tax=Steccherinum ochraceum TaxID=92696 RepID=A0A4R0RP10_9APHY|nr:hypothetical protein EIP91_000601 [Steccherinum ochraceum]
MSQAKLTLRPPPNIDFVQGYPGIPPGPPERPQAAVKGAIEVRVGPQGVKAKWVRIELRKIETLPGGGLTNTFFDFVGQSPISLWQSGEEYSLLCSQDFPFQIRIPESIPPSIALEKGAGVKYELIATLCIKGKKGFLKRDKHNIIATSSPIIIDKHELHSTWPVYTQPEGRKLTQEGVTLTVERSHTCFGPGDRITVNAIVRSDSLSTVILRGFEFSLRETTVFRAGPHTTGKKGAPQVKVANVGEQKVPVNATLYGGTQHKAELSATVPSHHTTTTLNAARHIDITYVLIVKALMGTGKPIVIDLPVVISNWPRAVSVEAVRRIGMAPNVQSQSVQGQPAVQIGSPIAQIGQPIMPAAQVQAVSAAGQPRPSVTGPHPFSSLNERPGTANSETTTAGRFNTAPINGNVHRNTADEFGFHNSRGTNDVLQIGSSALSSSVNSRPVASDTSSTSGGHTNTTGAGLRSRPSDRGAAAPATNRLTVTNFGDDMPEEAASQAAALTAAASARAHQRQASLTTRGTPAASSRSNNGWLPAEEEKRRLYERAVADVERVQGGLGSPTPSGNADAGRAPPEEAKPAAPAAAASSSSKWMTAEEEKARLFNEAQAAAQRLHSESGLTPPGTAQGGGSSAAGALSRNTSATATTASPPLSGAALYAQAMSSVHRNASAGNSSASAPAPAKRYPTAEEEKAEMRRYHEAKAAVERNQMGMLDAGPINEAPMPSAPISYEALYGPGPGTTSPSAATHSVTTSPNGFANSPSAFSEAPSSPGPMSAFDALTEKERMRRAYEQQDAMAAAAVLRSPAQSTINNVPIYPMSAQAPAYMPSPPPSHTMPMSPPSAGPMNALSEKELLRQRYEAQDAAAAPGPAYSPPVAQMANGAGGGPTPSPPPRRGGGSLRERGLPNPRGQPTPPVAGGSSQPLSAVEEKARLRAMYEAQDSPRSQPMSTPSTPPSHYAPSPYSYSPSPPSPPHHMMSNGMNGVDVHRQNSVPLGSIPPPPPLAPRPPKEYIEETREEDARTAAKLHAMDNGAAIGDDTLSLHLTMKPFTPFTPGFDIHSPITNMERPPLPTKV